MPLVNSFQQSEYKKPNVNLTQVMMSSEQQFILAKKIRESVTDVVCPFIKMDKNYYSKFFVPIGKLAKIQSLYELIPGVATYNVSDSIVSFDCVKRLPDDMFGQAETGLIHLTTIDEKKKQNELEIGVEGKLTFKNIDPKTYQINYDQKTRFKTDFLKTFPSILNKGFIFTTIDKQVCQIYFSIMNPSELYVGECSKFEVINIIQRILPLWSIFDIIISDTYKIYLRKTFIKDIFRNEKSPILLRASYNLEKSNDITLSKIAEFTNID